MIPIIYDKDETAFVSNGLGRLQDCISCVVTEERNGVFECNFEYPVTGLHYDRIQVGRTIGVTHDETGNIQPFDIVSYTKPINGVVTFHCTHISYRQSYLTVTGTNINSLTNAFNLLKNSATPSNPFTYWTDKTSTGYLPSADGIPKTVRSMLGGTEGSILDIYGGEYEWDRFTVKLHSSRGGVRDFAIRYGVNMSDYNEEYDISGTYSSCIPYWTDGTNSVIGDKQTATGTTITGRGECIPLDVSDRFEDKPTKAQVNTMGRSVMNSQNPTLPVQNISVSFVRLQDAGELDRFRNLMDCKLCDTITVIFPDFNASGQFKIVKTEWDVLLDRYKSLELGSLSTSLAEALGINNTGGTNSSVKNTYYYASGSYNVTATGQDITLCTLTLPANKRLLVLSNVVTDSGNTFTLLNYIPVISGSGYTKYGANTRVTTSSGQGVANWSLIETTSSITIALRGYSYPNGGTGYKQTGYLIAIEL